jgi:hypothetical protein
MLSELTGTYSNLVSGHKPASTNSTFLLALDTRSTHVYIQQKEVRVVLARPYELVCYLCTDLALLVN